MVKGSWLGAGPSVCNPADVVLRQTKRGAGKITYQGKLYAKEASHLCMDIYMHGFPARFIFFINMLIQVQALQKTSMDMIYYII